jgi:hypothetical protein
MMIRSLWVGLVEWLHLRTIQGRYVEGTYPDDGGHGELRIAWNDSRGHNRPLFVVLMTHTRTGQRTRLLLSPNQLHLFMLYGDEALGTQSRSFGYDVTNPPEYDTRWMRVPDES